MEKKIIFNHIPKTGGTSLRIILNRIYGQDKVFFIKSTDLSGSLNLFRDLPSEQQNKYKVIAGHGANKFSQFIKEPNRITVLRDPVDLFISQYHYLKQSPNSNFQKQVKELSSINEYLDYAIKEGQDNLMTRYLSSSIDWLFNTSIPIPNLNDQGNFLLEKAKENLHTYDAVLRLERFDSGVYSLSKKLNWNRIPFYRPANKTEDKPDLSITNKFLERLNFSLRFDIELYNYFLKNNLDIAQKSDENLASYKLFHLRQRIINRFF